MVDGIIDSMDMNLSKLEDSEGQGSLVCCSPCVIIYETTLMHHYHPKAVYVYNNVHSWYCIICGF